MAVNETRNLGQELRSGLSDGTVRKSAPNRGGAGVDEYAFQKSMRLVSDEYYGYDGADVAHNVIAARLTTVNE